MEHETWSVDRIQVCAKQTQPVESRSFVLGFPKEDPESFRLPRKHVRTMHDTSHLGERFP